MKDFTPSQEDKIRQIGAQASNGEYENAEQVEAALTEVIEEE